MRKLREVCFGNMLRFESNFRPTGLNMLVYISIAMY